MSHQLCQSCGSSRFEHIDGRLYCVVCQSQNISMQFHVSFANEGSAQLGRRVRDQAPTTSMLDETMPKIEIFEENEITSRTLNQADDDATSRMTNLSVDDNEQLLLEQHVWSSYEVYSYILNIQVQAILRLNQIEHKKHKEFSECTFLLFLRYLSANGILDTEQNRLLRQQEERRLKINQLAKHNYNLRLDHLAKRNTHVVKKNLGELNLDILIGLIHCSSILINSPLTIKQLIRWINTHQLPYYNIRDQLPRWMRTTGRDRYNLEKMRIHPETFLVFYQDFLRPMLKPYLFRCIFQSQSYFYRILLHLCQISCKQIYFPYDDDTRPLFEALGRTIVDVELGGRRFLSTSVDLELSALVMIIVVVLLRSIHDPLLDQFVQHSFREKIHLFSYSVWLKNLNALIHLDSIRDYQFFGRSSVLVQSITDNLSKERYIKSFSKVFQPDVRSSYEQENQTIEQIEQVLRKNCQSGSLIYAMKTEAFLRQEFSQSLVSDSLPSLVESVVNTHSPPSFSLVDKSELYETCLSLVNGATITQIEQFYLLYQRFDFASSSNFPLQHLISTVTRVSCIPYNQEFHSFLSRFLKAFCFHQRFHCYFYQPTRLRRTHQKSAANQIGMRQYGTDQVPIPFDLKLEQEHAVKPNEIK